MSTALSAAASPFYDRSSFSSLDDAQKHDLLKKFGDAIKTKNHFQMNRLLRTYEIPIKPFDGFSPLFTVVYNFHVEGLRVLIEHHVDLQEKDEYNNTVWGILRRMKGGKEKEKENMLLLLAPHFGDDRYSIHPLSLDFQEAIKNTNNKTTTGRSSLPYDIVAAVPGLPAARVSSLHSKLRSMIGYSKQNMLTNAASQPPAPLEQEVLSGQQQTIIQTLEAFSKATRLCDYEQVKATLNSLKRQYFDHDHPDGDWQISYLYMILAEFSYSHFDTDVRCEIFSFIKELLMLNMRVRDASIFDKHKDLFQKVLDKLKLPPEHPDRDSEELQFKEAFIRHHRNVIPLLITFQTIKPDQIDGNHQNVEGVIAIIKELIDALNDPKDKGNQITKTKFNALWKAIRDIDHTLANSHLLCVEFFKYIIQRSCQFESVIFLLEEASASCLELKNDVDHLHMCLRGVLELWETVIQDRDNANEVIPKLLQFLNKLEIRLKETKLSNNLQMCIIKVAEIGLELKSLEDPGLSAFGAKILNSVLLEKSELNYKEKAKKMVSSAKATLKRRIEKVSSLAKKFDSSPNPVYSRFSDTPKKSMRIKSLTSFSPEEFRNACSPTFDNLDWAELCNKLLKNVQIANPLALSSIAFMYKSGKSEDEIIKSIEAEILPELLPDIEEFSKSRLDIPKEKWIYQFCVFLINKAHISFDNPKKEGKMIAIDDENIKLSFKSEDVDLYLRNEENIEVTELDAATADVGIFWVDKSDPLGLTKLAKDLIENSRAKKNIELTADQSIECILSYIESGIAAAKKAEGKSLLMLVGGTGTGKSTTINWLSGCNMIKIPDPENKHKKVIEAENPVAKIGHFKISDTFLPSIYPTDKIFLCDTPGTGDNRGPEVDIANSVNIRTLLTSAGDLRFLILISYSMLLEKKKNGLDTYFNGLKSTCGGNEGLKQVFKSMLFGITQVLKCDEDQINMLREELRLFFKKEIAIDIEEEQIVFIEPLGESGLCLNRIQFLEKALALPKIDQGKEQFNQSSLDDRGNVLLHDIVEKMEKNIADFWSKGQFKKVAQEYNKLELLSAIGNKKIDDCLLETRAKIQRHITDEMNHIKIILKSRDFRQRKILKQTIRKFKEVKVLDECFDQPIISTKVDEVEQFVREEETAEQNNVDKIIKNEIEIVYKRFEGDLNKLRENSSEILKKLDLTSDILPQLLSRSSIASVKEFNFLVSEIEKEMNLRPIKYYFPNIDDLESIKYESEERVKKLCNEAITTFILDSFKTKFESHYDRVLTNRDTLVERHQDQLYPEQLDFIKLKDYEFDIDSIDGIIGTLRSVKELSDSKGEVANDLFKHFEKLISNLMKDIHMKAKEMKTATLINSIQKELHEYDSRVKDYSKLKASLKLLSEISTPASAYDDVCNEMYNVLIKKQELERDRVIMATDLSYVEDIARLRAHAESLKQFETYIPLKTTSIFIENLEKAILRYELARYNEICDGIQNSFDTCFGQLDLGIDEILVTNPEDLSTLELDVNNIFPSLKKLTEKVEKSRPYLEVFLRMKEVLDTWNDRFVLTEMQLRENNENKSEDLKHIYKQEIGRIKHVFDITMNKSQISTLTQLIEDALKLLVQSIKISIPTFVRMLAIDNKFAQSIDGLAKFFKNDRVVQVFTKNQQIQCIHEQLGIIEDARIGMAKLNADMDKLDEKIKPLLDDIKRELNQAAKDFMAKEKKKKVNEATTKIYNILVAGKIAENVDEFPLFYDELQNISEEDYKESLEMFKKALQSFKDPIKVNEYLSLENYEKVTSIYFAVNRLKQSMARHIDINESDIMESIKNYIGIQFKAAIAQIHTEPNDDNYLNIDKIEKVTNIITSLHKGELLPNPKVYIREIHKEALNSLKKIDWSEGLDPHATQMEKKHILMLFCKRLCKYFAIYRSLVLLHEYKDYMKKQFDKLEKLEIVESGTRNTIFSPIEDVSLKLTELQDDKVMGAIVQEIIDEIPQFKKVKIKFYKKKITADFNSSLIEIRDKGSYNIDRARLREIYKHYKIYYDELVTKILSSSYDPEQVKNEAYQCIAKLRRQFELSETLYQNPIELGKVIAAISTQWSYLSSIDSFQKGDKDTFFEIHDTQILGILRLIGADNPGKIKNHLTEILTGEGKSVSLGMTATLFALLGYDVDVVCYSSYLSQRDYKMFKVLFDDFNVGRSIRYMRIDDLVSSFFGKYIPSPSQALRSILKGETYSHSIRKRGKNLLLIDEVDVFFGENFYGDRYSCLGSLDHVGQKQLFEYVWQNKNRLTNSNFIYELKEQTFMKDIMRAYPKFDVFVDEKLKEVIDDASYIASGRKLPDSFVIQNNQIGCKDHSLGEVVFSRILGYKTTFAYIDYCDKGILKRTEANDDHYFSFYFHNCYFLYSEIPNFYDLKLGMTGTLSSLSSSEEKVLERYEFTERTYVPSAFDRKIIQVEETQIISGDRNEEYFDAIKMEIVKCITDSRCAIVVFEDQSKMEDFKATLKQKPSEAIKVIEELTEETPNGIRDSIISKAIAQRKVLFITAIFGRGTDFVCRDSGLVRAGGVEVILTFCPRMDAEEIQIKGRTGRQDNPGRFIKIIYSGDLVDRGLLGTNSNGAPNIIECGGTGGERDEYLRSKREELDEKRFKKMEDNMEKNKKKHDLSFEMYKCAQNGDFTRAIEILKEFQ